MPSAAVRTRFAPSPTGRLHLGNARVAVFNWLFARRHAGAFVLRIEDTDPERTVEGSEAGIVRDLRWLGLEWDEGPDVGGGHGPYRQSERGREHDRHVERLLESGRAYRCWCTDAELEAESERVGERSVLRYSGRCRRLDAGERAEMAAAGRESAVRFALPEGVEAVEIEDQVRGYISFPTSDMDDFIVRRRDGRVTYNLAVVADDLDMEITHVIRGAGHLSNTPKQALLFDALERERPRFAHLPTVLAPDGGKLSKRHGGAALSDLRDAGYHPDGVVNYLSLLGWSSPDGREVLTPGELAERISLERVGASDTAFDPEKLRWASGRHLREMEPGALARAVEPWLDGGRYPLSPEALERAMAVLRSRMTTFDEVNEHLAELYPGDGALDAGRSALAGDPERRAVVERVARALREVEAWDAETLGRAVRSAGREAGARGPALFHPLRLALAGKTSGPDLGGILAALGPEEGLRRLSSATEG